jgi:hypothetical protein
VVSLVQSHTSGNSTSFYEPHTHRIGSVATGAELSRTRSPEHDCVMLELVLVAIVLGEPAVELWARLRAGLKTTKARRRTPCHY